MRPYFEINLYIPSSPQSDFFNFILFQDLLYNRTNVLNLFFSVSNELTLTSTASTKIHRYKVNFLECNLKTLKLMAPVSMKIEYSGMLSPVFLKDNN